MNRMQQTRQCSFIWRLWSLLWTEYGNMPVINCIKKELFIKNFLCKCEQILRKMWICQHLLKKSLIKNFIFVWALPIYSVQSARKNIITGQISIFYVFNFVFVLHYGTVSVLNWRTASKHKWKQDPNWPSRWQQCSFSFNPCKENWKIRNSYCINIQKIRAAESERINWVPVLEPIGR